MEKYIVALHKTLPRPIRRDGFFCTEPFLFSCSSASDMFFCEETRTVLDALCRKIEVGKTLCSVYPQEILGSSVDGKRVDPAYMIMACALMAHAARQFGESAYLNCALKMLDGLATPKADYPDWLHAEVRKLAVLALSWWRV